MELIENRMILDYNNYEFNTDEYDRRMEALAQREDEEWEDMD